MADWSTYRQKLATTTGATPAIGALKQTAAGKITTLVEDNVTVAREPSREVLRLSKAEELGRASDKEGNASQDRIRAMEKEADDIAMDSMLSEVGERIVLLEKQSNELQRLLKLKSTTMAKAQKQAESINAEEEIISTINDWARAWSSKDVATYLEFYAVYYCR